MDPFISHPALWYEQAPKEAVADALAAAAAALQRLTRVPAAQPAAARQLWALLKAVQAALQHGKAGAAAPTGALVPSLQSLMGYGADQRPSPPTPRGPGRPPAAAPAAQRSPGKYVPPSARRLNASSDSESSDAEQGGGEAGLAGRVRALALACLQLLTKAEPKAMHPFWTALLPASDVVSGCGAHARWLLRSSIPCIARPASGSTPPRALPVQPAAPPAAATPSAAPPSLAHVLLLSPSPRLRHAAAATLSTLLEGPAQRAYLAVAEARSLERAPVRGFVALSASLGQAVVATQLALLRCAAQERDPAVLAAALRALGTLLVGAPHGRLPPELLPRSVDALAGCLRQAGAALPAGEAAFPEQLTVLSGCLSCLAAALGAKPPSAALGGHLSAAGGGGGGGGALVEALLGHARRGGPGVRLEAVLALRGAAQQYPSLLEGRWEAVLELGAAGAALAVPGGPPSPGGGPPAAAPPPECSAAERVAQQSILLTGDWLLARAAPPAAPQPGAPAAAALWRQALARCFRPALRHASPVLRAAALGAVSCLPVAAAGALGPERDALLREACAAAVGDGASPVRAAAAKALASLLLAPDWAYAAATSELVVGTLQRACADAVLAVRAQAAGALGSAGGAMLAAAAADAAAATPRPPRLQENIGALMALAVAACADGDKVKPGGVQALGALLAAGAALGGAAALPPAGVAALLGCLRGGSAKVQWGACDAAGVYLRAAPAGAAPALAGALAELAAASDNQRTRALAAAALGGAGGAAQA
jgi:hypothetical protein